MTVFRSKTASTTNVCGMSSNEAPSARARDVPPTSTEYGQSFQARRNSKGLLLRNPLSGWHSRNLSNILPSTPAAPRRTQRRPPPREDQNWLWRDRNTAPRIFPNENNNPNPGQPETPLRDVNNNPMAPRPARRRPPRPRAAESSNIFRQDAPRPSTAPPRNPPAPKWPWQERAKKSVIFELMMDKGEEGKEKKNVSGKHHRTYLWDQRQSTLVSEAVHQQTDSISTTKPVEPPTKPVEARSSKSSSSTSPSVKPSQSNKIQPVAVPAVGKGSKWPWQERALRSVLFDSPDKVSLPREIKYVWDQRRTRLSVNFHPEATFPKGSHYKENYPQWKQVPDNVGMKPAGKPCYTDDFDQPKREKSGKRRSQAHHANEESLKKEISQESLKKEESKSQCAEEATDAPIPLPSPSSRSESSSNESSKNSSCTEVVPLGYCFSETNIGDRKNRRMERSI